MTTSVRPLQLGVAGMSHDHIFSLLKRRKQGDFEITGIAEPDSGVVNRIVAQFGIEPTLIYSSLDEMLEKTHPEAVTAFGSIYDHLQVVEACAPRGVHILVEKPLAVSMEHASRMAALARQHHVHLLTNYETTWYASNHTLYQRVHGENQVGRIRKVVVHDGHEGPQEIGCTSDFLKWLTDPVLNGGGAVVDFGCYGANLITWLMDNQRPNSVTAVLQQLKPDIYPRVDDDATVIVTYPHAQGIIQGSWNWPIGRKDMEVYGQTGYVYATDRVNLRYRQNKEQAEHSEKLDERAVPYNDPFSWLGAVVRGEINVTDDDLSSLANNLIVVEILDAARESARTGQTVHLQQ